MSPTVSDWNNWPRLQKQTTWNGRWRIIYVVSIILRLALTFLITYLVFPIFFSNMKIEEFLNYFSASFGDDDFRLKAIWFFFKYSNSWKWLATLQAALTLENRIRRLRPPSTGIDIFLEIVLKLRFWGMRPELHWEARKCDFSYTRTFLFSGLAIAGVQMEKWKNINIYSITVVFNSLLW